MILIVDDDSDLRDILADFLIEEGFEAVCVASASEALEFLLESRPKLIILDLMMPGMDGTEFLSKADGNGTRDIPVLLMTGATLGTDAQEALKRNVDEILIVQKPMNPHAMVEVIRRLLIKSP